MGTIEEVIATLHCGKNHRANKLEELEIMYASNSADIISDVFSNRFNPM